MTTPRNTSPGDPFEALRRLYACNWSQLAARLGISAKSLRQWRADWPEATPRARLALSELLRTALRTSEADRL